MSNQGINSLATIIKRLEAAASRLEDVAAASTGLPLLSARSTTAIQESLSSHLPSSASAPVPTTTSKEIASAPALSEPMAESAAVKAYREEILEGALAEFVEKSGDVGGLVLEHAQLLLPLTTAQLAFLNLASNSKKPATPQALLPLLQPTQEALQAVVAFKDKAGRTKEGRAWGNHFSALGEGVGAWGWVAVEPTPAPFVKDMKDSAQFYTNRVIKEFKESDPKQIAWSQSLMGLLEALGKYVRQYHTTGVVWNPKGSEATSAPSSAPSATAPSASTTPKAPGGGFLAALNQGGAVTSGLKKVDPSEMTHKNPALRATSVVAETPKAAPPKPVKPAAVVAKKPPKTELDGTKWVVEYHENNDSIVIDQTELNHTVHLFGCKNSVVQIKGKVNAINVVNCQKTSILLDSVVSQLSITSSPSFTVQILGTVPTILIDTTDSGQVYLSEACVDSTEIITSKTSALNISLPPPKEGEDFTECAMPEQMKTVIKGGKLVTSIVEHSG